MPLLLATPHHLPDPKFYDCWAVQSGSASGLGEKPLVPGLAEALEAAYDAVAADWLAIARRLGQEPSATLAHMPACAANVSDFGLMLAWSKLAAGWAGGSERVLLICDDPWLFRHLAPLAIAHSAAESLRKREFRLAVRGYMARSRAAVRFALQSIRARRNFPKGAPALLVYGHPASLASGFDGYFGDLLARIPGLARILHVDAPPARAKDLGCASLHAWGSPWRALALPFARWRPRDFGGWLERRAWVMEGATATPAAIAWQVHCQEAWLRDCAPRAVAWPWENHSWERAFVRQARTMGVRTVGYQHATVGNREWNYGPGSNPDGAASLPDRILANGPAGRAALQVLGHGEVGIGGAFRLRAPGPLPRDPGGPVFVALPHDQAIAAEMVEACRAVPQRRFLIKDHPMTPFPFDETPTLVRTTHPLGDQDGLSAVLYAGTTVGLEAVLGGLPCLRFRPRCKVPTDVMPPGVTVPVASAETLALALDGLAQPPRLAAADIVSPPDLAVWRDLL